MMTIPQAAHWVMERFFPGKSGARINKDDSIFFALALWRALDAETQAKATITIYNGQACVTSGMLFYNAVYPDGTTEDPIQNRKLHDH